MRLWNAYTGDIIRVLKGDRAIISLAYSPDGKVIAAGSFDGNIYLWDVDKGEVLKVFQGHSGWVRVLSYSPGGRVIASGADDCTIRLWDVNTGECLKTLGGHAGFVRTLVYHPNGEVIVASSDGEPIRLWSIDTGELLLEFEKKYNAESLAYSPDGERIAFAFGNDVNLCVAKTTESIRILQGHTGKINVIRFSPDGRILASGASDGTVRLWDVETGMLFKVFESNGKDIDALAYSHDGQWITFGDRDGAIWVQKVLLSKLLYDFDPIDVSGALQFLWEMKPDGLELMLMPHEPTLLPQEGGYYISLDDETRKYVPLLKLSESNQSKMEQVVSLMDDIEKQKYA